MNAAELEAARAEHFRQSPHLALRSNAAAIDFIEQMGLLLLFRSGKLALPNLADACVGGHWAWGADPTGLSAWELKETIPASGRAFYARLIAGRGTFVRWSLVPALLAAWQPERRARRLDELEDLALGVVTLHGPISTRRTCAARCRRRCRARGARCGPRSGACRSVSSSRSRAEHSKAGACTSGTC